MTEGTNRIGALVDHLCALIDAYGHWSIQAEETARLLGVDMVSFWRAIHGLRERISFSEAIDGWSQDNVGDLVTVMEKLTGERAEQEMTRAGLFLSYALGIELIDELQWKARRLAAAHVVRTDELEGMLRHSGNVRKAIGIYLSACTDVDELIEESAESFRILNGLPPRAAATASRYLRGMFARHVLDSANLFAGLHERLFLEAAKLGYVDPNELRGEQKERESERRGRRKPAGDGYQSNSGRTPRHPMDRQAWARRVMGLDGGACTAEELRSAYRRLMMRHHPDVDPTGLEKCKDVNVAYAFLIGELSPDFSE